MGAIDLLRQLYEERRLDEAWTEYQRLLVDPVGPEGHLLGALTARLKGNPIAARNALYRAENAGATGAVLGKTRMTLGVVLREIGDTTEAIDTLERFLQEMDQYPELAPLATGAGHYNLAMAYRSVRRYDEALRSYETAADEFRREHMRCYLGQCLRNLAWLRCLVGDYGMAKFALDEALPLAETANEHWDAHLGMALWHSLAGDQDYALQLCHEILQSEHRPDAAPPEAISHACWIAGRIALARDQVMNARAMADAAVEWAVKVSQDVRPLHDASALRREVHERTLHKKTEGA